MSNISRNIQGFEIYQRKSDGYINATQICKVHQEITGERKDPRNWLVNKTSKSMIEHLRLAVRFAMWVNDDFSLQVEDWVQEWMATKQNPIHTEIKLTEPTIDLLLIHSLLPKKIARN